MPEATTKQKTETENGVSQQSTPQSSAKARQLWHKTVEKLIWFLRASACFRTLRNMSEGLKVECGQLRKVKNLGKGGFCRVTLEKLKVGEQSEQLVAVKRVKANAVETSADLVNIYKEAAILHRLHHRNITAYMGVGEDSGWFQFFDTPFIVQEYVNGGSLKRLLERQQDHPGQPQYSLPEALRWCRGTAAALEHLHTRLPCIVHRDVKLDNILLRVLPSGEREAVLCDLGLHVTIRHGSRHDPKPEQLARKKSQAVFNERIEAIITRDHSGTASVSGRALSDSVRSGSVFSQISASLKGRRSGDLRYGTFVKMDSMRAEALYNFSGEKGSWAYMAPEVFRNESYNEKADVFAAGCVLYELFGRYQIGVAVLKQYGILGQPLKDYAAKVAKGFRRPIPEGWPDELRSLIRECWSQKPRDRPSMSQVHERLRSPTLAAALQEAGASGEAWPVWHSLASAPEGGHRSKGGSEDNEGGGEGRFSCCGIGR